ncbi:hypothetical protein EV715DRAFT_257035, partial [Schizophyllum commune]
MTPALLRFAPSPTGALHLGGLRMAAYNYLYAKKTGGKWIMRVEDTDATRFVPGSVEGIIRSLEWAGLEYDYGPGKDGPHKPYFQSERLDLYKHHADKLLESGHAYRCFCTPDELNDTRERLARQGSNTTYDRRCMHLTDEEVHRRIRAGHKHTIRINDTNLPPRPANPPADLVFPNLRDAHASLATDPILLKSDLRPTYHLASVVDDHAMGITHVLRGEEWLTSAPLHRDLYAAFGWGAPAFAHIPILLNRDGTKMSKRHGHAIVDDYIKRGWEPQAVLNWLVLAGWGVTRDATGQTTQEAPDSTRLMTVEEMIAEFDITKLAHRSVILDPAKLEYLNKYHLAKAVTAENSLNALARKVAPKVRERYGETPYTSLENIKRVIKVLDVRLTNLFDLPSEAAYFFAEPDLTTEEAKSMVKTVPPAMQAKIFDALDEKLRVETETYDGVDILGLVNPIAKEIGAKRGDVLRLMRYAVTGAKGGPALADTVKLLGPKLTLRRIEAARGNVDGTEM